MGKEKSGVFFADRVGFKVSFLEISQCRHVRDLISKSGSAELVIQRRL